MRAEPRRVAPTPERVPWRAWGHRTPPKETTVSRPIAAVRNWAIEQVTAIVSVTRPIHLPQRTRR